MSKKHTYQITGQQNCGNCLYYLRHYICREGAFYSLSYGHCIFPRLKSGRPMLPAPIGRLLTEGTTCRGTQKRTLLLEKGPHVPGARLQRRLYAGLDKSRRACYV